MNGAIEFFRKLGPGRIGAMFAVTAALIGFFAFVIMRVTQPDMALLYGDLSLQDSMAVTRDLDTRGIKYELRGDGQAIMVPRSEITKLRLDFAGKGLPSGGGVGYEIFDKGDAFSATSFVQNINQLRALEGELSRTIRGISRVQQARVHLVIPERRLFERDREGPRASIVLRVAGELDSGQVRAIRHLVATSVDGLKPERISIVDERGRLLADGAQGDTDIGAAADEKQVAYERRLRQQVEDIVAGVVGQGRARVQVSAQMDVNRIENRSETFDPESRVVRSTQTRTEASSTDSREGGVTVGNELPGAGANANQNANAPRDNSNKNEEVINYEISRTTRTEVTEGGRLKRLSVAVLVDGNYTAPPGGGSAAYQPRSQEELDRISALVRTAIGFDKGRGDQVEVVNLRFADPPAAPEASAPTSFLEPFFSFGKDDILRGAELGILAILSLIVILVVVRPMVRQIIGPEIARPLMAALAPPGGGGGASGGRVNDNLPEELFKARDDKTQRMLDIVKVNGQVAAASVERIGEMVKHNPQETVAVLRQWIHENA